MALGTQGDEILLCIIAEQTACLNMVELQFARTPAMLAMPSVALEHPLAQSFVSPLIEPQPRASLSK